MRTDLPAYRVWKGGGKFSLRIHFPLINFAKKAMLRMLFGGLLFFSSFGCAQSPPAQEPMESIYDIILEGIDGKLLDLSKFKGKKILFVNVASEGGFTGQ